MAHNDITYILVSNFIPLISTVISYTLDLITSIAIVKRKCDFNLSLLNGMLVKLLGKFHISSPFGFWRESKCFLLFFLHNPVYDPLYSYYYYHHLLQCPTIPLPPSWRLNGWTSSSHLHSAAAVLQVGVQVDCVMVQNKKEFVVCPPVSLCFVCFCVILAANQFICRGNKDTLNPEPWIFLLPALDLY